MLKRTPLFEVYKDYQGAKLIDFGGWELPVNFEAGIINEHLAVRKNAGLFDVSHMGEITIEGAGSEEFIHWLLTNNVKSMKDYQCLYSPMCYPNGGVVDDLLVYRYNQEKYLLVVNAANTDKDYKWITEENDWVKSGKKLPAIKNVSAEYVQIAFQGPKANDYMKEIVGELIDGIEFFHFQDGLKIAGTDCIVSRTGYTGEDGFEIYMPTDIAPQLWDRIMEAGKEEGLLPAGLGARDTLRFEACLPLYGHELEKDITPLEAGLKFTVKLDKADFIGKKALAKQKEEGLKRKIVGLEMLDKGVPRHGYEVCAGEQAVGTVTSGSFAPTLGAYLALALVEAGYTGLGTELEIDIRGRKKAARVVKMPFYTPRYKR